MMVMPWKRAQHRLKWFWQLKHTSVWHMCSRIYACYQTDAATLTVFILISICFSFYRLSTWHQLAKNAEKESICTDKWQRLAGNSAVHVVRRLHFIFQIIDVNVIRMQSINHFNMFANSAEPTRLLLGKTHRAHDVARSNEDGLCHEPDALLFCLIPSAVTAPFCPRVSCSHDMSLTTTMSEVGVWKAWQHSKRTAHCHTGCELSP